jgi:hypothetical protein
VHILFQKIFRGLYPGPPLKREGRRGGAGRGEEEGGCEEGDDRWVEGWEGREGGRGEGREETEPLKPLQVLSLDFGFCAGYVPDACEVSKCVTVYMNMLARKTQAVHHFLL